MSDPKKRVGLYARVSTSSQNVDMQIQELREYVARRNWKLAGEYVDSGISGSKVSRPQLDRLMSDCRKRKVDIVCVYRFDRFARSLRQLVTALEEFNALGIEFISLHEQIDTGSPAGKLVFGIFASIAEFEKSLIRDRVLSGIARARAKGTRLGRPNAKLDLHKLRTLREDGVGWKKAAAAMGNGVATIIKAAKEHGIA